MNEIYTNSDLFKDFTQKDLDAYGGLSKSVANYQNREYLNIEPGISVRPQFDRRDYESFRPGEATATQQKNIIKDCMSAYDNVGIIRNIIDLMADFACQGLTIVHKDPKIQSFYRKWFTKVNGYDRSERFLNYLYRMGNVIVHRTNAKITKKEEREFKKSVGSIEEVEPSIYRRLIPWSYEFLNPLKIGVNTSDSGQRFYTIKIGDRIISSRNNNTNIDYLPDYILEQVKAGKDEAVLDMSNISISYYKKDDWLLWANPMIHPILDDIMMLQKMRLADVAALDGAISNIRLWTIGDLEHKIVPREPIINKLRNIIASNVGGGTFDLIWGPDLKFQESNTQVYKFLGEEKYRPVLNSIYQGLGISAAITGSSGNASYTNNYVSVKVLIERLEYGRKVLKSFWDEELEIIQKAMKFSEPAQIHFDGIVLADEASVRNLLIDLADRSIISEETLLERFKELPDIEKTRLKKEFKARKKDLDIPRKASPFHSPSEKEELAKTALQSQQLGPAYFEEIGLPYQKPPAPTPTKSGVSPAKKPKRPSAGRPLAKKDAVKRKTKRVLPKTKGYDQTTLLLWAEDAQKNVSNILTPIYLAVAGKKNVRSLTKEEFSKLEQLKLSAFLTLRPFQAVDENVIKISITEGRLPSTLFLSKATAKIQKFYEMCLKKPSIEEIRTIYSSVYSEIYAVGV